MSGNYNEATSTRIPAHLDQSRVTSLLFSYANWKETKAEVIEPTSQNVLYTIDYKMRKPHLHFRKTKDDSPLGNVVFHFTSTGIDVEIGDQSFTMKLKKIFKSDYTYESPALQNQTMTWTSKSGWSTFDYVCLDQHQLPVAKITASAWKSKDAAQIDFVGAVGDDEAAREEILVTGLALTYYMILNQRAAVS